MLCECGFLLGLVTTVVGGLEIGRWDVAAELVEAVVVEPVDPFGGGDLRTDSGALTPSSRATFVIAAHSES